DPFDEEQREQDEPDGEAKKDSNERHRHEYGERHQARKHDESSHRGLLTPIYANLGWEVPGRVAFTLLRPCRRTRSAGCTESPGAALLPLRAARASAVRMHSARCGAARPGAAVWRAGRRHPRRGTGW